MNKYIKSLLYKNNDLLITLPKIKKTNIINLLKYEVTINFNYPLINIEHSISRNYNKLFLIYIKHRAPEYYFLLTDLNKNGIHISNYYTKISGWYFESEKDNIVDDVIIIFYINKNNESIIDKKINELYNKYQIKNIDINKKETFINTYDIINNGILFISQDPFDLSKRLYIYVYGICDELNSFISFTSYYYNTLIKYKKIFITYYKYFSIELEGFEYNPQLLDDINKFNYQSKTGYNIFSFIDKSIITPCNIRSDINYEFSFLNIIELTDLPNNVKLFLKKIKYKSFTILLYEQGPCININEIYKFINNSKIDNFFIVKENVMLKNELRIKVLSSNILYEPLKIESGAFREFL